MKILFFPGEFSICKLTALPGAWPKAPGEPYFLAVTPDEISLVCRPEALPEGSGGIAKRDDGWAMFRIAGELDFGLVGILARISAALAEKGVSIFAVSTYDTDYVLVKKESAAAAREALAAAGFEV